MFYNGIIVNNITDFCSRLSQEPSTEASAGRKHVFNVIDHKTEIRAHTTLIWSAIINVLFVA